MGSIERFERWFEGAQELPWVASSKPFDFDAGFVGWIQRRYLPLVLKREVRDVERFQAVQWINRAKFDQERLENCWLQWMEWQRMKTDETDGREEGQGAESRGLEVNEGVRVSGCEGDGEEEQKIRERVREMLRQRGLE